MDKPKSKHRPWDRIRTEQLNAPIASRKRDAFYHTSRWKKESKAFRISNPLCAQCFREEILTPAEVTDHKIPKDICADPWDKSNWEGLCKPCHAKKGSKDRKHFKK